MSRPLAIDLCCGAGGMTAGMVAAGFEVLGVDVVARRDYPAPLLRQDVRQVDASRLGRPVWVHASPPCNRFSNVRGNRIEDPPTDRDLDLLRACVRIRDEVAPAVWSVENVRGARSWFEPVLGQPSFAHGPYLFWGNFPAFLVGRSGLRKDIGGGKGAPQRHRSPWLRAKVPTEIAEPMAQAVMAEVWPAATEGGMR